MKSKKTKMNPVEALAKLRDDKMLKAEGSMLEGGKMVYKNGGPKNPPNNKIFAGITAGVGAAAAWNRERMAKKDVGRYQAAGIIADPTSKKMSYDDALNKVTELRGTQEGRQQLRGLRATGKRNVNIKDFRAEQKKKRKARRNS